MLIALLVACRSGPPALEPGPDLDGTCHVGDAVWTGAHLVVADPTRNVLRVYDPAGTAGTPIDLGALSPVLQEPADLEAMATAPDGTTWILGAHAGGGEKGADGAEVHATATHRLLGVRLTEGPQGVTAALVAGPGTGLIESGQWTNPLLGIVDNTVGHPSRSADGLAIAGVAARPDGSLVLGFRAPTHGHKALIEQLRDPTGAAGGGSPSLGGPYWLDLGGAGIRSIAADGQGFVLVAGPPGDDADGPWAVYRWAGLDLAQKPIRVDVDLGDLHPDAVVNVNGRWWLLGGGEAGAGCDARPPGDQHVRTGLLSGG